MQTYLTNTITLAYFHMVGNCPVLSDKLKRLTKVLTTIKAANLRISALYYLLFIEIELKNPPSASTNDKMLDKDRFLYSLLVDK